ncbi:uncharacterized protein LOC130054901 [Ostrea edulis]|uniref:uncharacterized protein LOC130054901 n=1 Tax=Ostrea edulis TaxID=37623 RepID=UPI0024AF8551|nr:uncharacterized protein LOC130054901 [Ostrea edulis]
MEQGVEVPSSFIDPQNGEGGNLACRPDTGQEEKMPEIRNGECGSQAECKKSEKNNSSNSHTHSENGEEDCTSSKTTLSLPRPEVSNPVGIETFDGDVQYQFGEPPPCECDACILEHLVDIKPPEKKFSRTGKRVWSVT